MFEKENIKYIFVGNKSDIKQSEQKYLSNDILYISETVSSWKTKDNLALELKDTLLQIFVLSLNVF